MVPPFFSQLYGIRLKNRCTRAGVSSDSISCHSFLLNDCRVGAEFIRLVEDLGTLASDGLRDVRV
jgi:hypothetical protein